MANIFDLVNAKEIGDFWETPASNRIEYLGASLFPAKKQLGLDLSWIKGASSLPVSLKPSNFDSKASVRDRIGVSKIDTEMPFFREAMTIKEKERQEILKLQGGSNAAILQPVLERIYNDAANLVAGAHAIAERMRMSLLSTGTISIASDGVIYEYDYKFPSAHKVELTSTDKWSDPSSTPILDIQGWQDKVEDDTGVRPKRGICTRKTFNYLLTNDSIKLDFDPINGKDRILTESDLRQYLERKLGLTVAIYNKKYAETLGGAGVNFYPDDYFTLIPEGNLGNTWYGTTPEEADLMNGATNADVRVVDTGIAITTIKEPHPVNVQTIVSEIVLPSFETIDSIFIAKVA